MRSPYLLTPVHLDAVAEFAGVTVRLEGCILADDPAACTEMGAFAHE
jgi:hypothetical protein